MQAFILIGEGWKSERAILGVFVSPELAKASDAVRDKNGLIIPIADRQWRDQATGGPNAPVIADTNMSSYAGVYPCYVVEAYTLNGA